MFKLLIFCLLIGIVLGDIVRIKTTVRRGKRPSSIHGKFPELQAVNQTLIDGGSDFFYTGNIHVGTPPKEFIVDFDTGSPTLWIAGVNCKYENGDACDAQEHKYDLSSSSTSKDLNQQFKITYGSGYTIGQYVTDIVGLTPNQTGVETEKSFKFAYATELDNNNDGTEWDGLFGLSFSEPRSKDRSYIEYLKDNKVFDPPIFSIWLDRDAYGKPLGGEIIFGGKDPEHCGNDLLTVPAGIEKPWWTFKVEKSFLNGMQIGGATKAITDTGTSYILAPRAAFAALNEKYPLKRTNGHPLISCDDYKDIELSIQVQGKLLKLNADDLISKYEDTGKCVIEIAENSDERWLLGDPFIKGYCQIHNYVDETVTFASLTHTKLEKGSFTPASYQLSYFGFFFSLSLIFLFRF